MPYRRDFFERHQQEICCACINRVEAKYNKSFTRKPKQKTQTQGYHYCATTTTTTGRRLQLAIAAEAILVTGKHERVPPRRSTQTASSQDVAGPRGSPPTTTTARRNNTGTTVDLLCAASKEEKTSMDAFSALVFLSEKILRDVRDLTTMPPWRDMALMRHHCWHQHKAKQSFRPRTLPQ